MLSAIDLKNYRFLLGKASNALAPNCYGLICYLLELLHVFQIFLVLENQCCCNAGNFAFLNPLGLHVMCTFRD